MKVNQITILNKILETIDEIDISLVEIALNQVLLEKEENISRPI